jgi:hypothetical protein
MRIISPNRVGDRCFRELLPRIENGWNRAEFRSAHDRVPTQRLLHIQLGGRL